MQKPRQNHPTSGNKHHRTKITAEQLNVIAQQINNGNLFSTLEAAPIFGVSSTHLNRRLAAAGLKVTRRRHRPRFPEGYSR